MDPGRNNQRRNLLNGINGGSGFVRFQKDAGECFTCCTALSCWGLLIGVINLFISFLFSRSLDAYCIISDYMDDVQSCTTFDFNKGMTPGAFGALYDWNITAGCPQIDPIEQTLSFCNELACSDCIDQFNDINYEADYYGRPVPFNTWGMFGSILFGLTGMIKLCQIMDFTWGTEGDSSVDFNPIEDLGPHKRRLALYEFSMNIFLLIWNSVEAKRNHDTINEYIAIIRGSFVLLCIILIPVQSYFGYWPHYKHHSNAAHVVDLQVLWAVQQIDILYSFYFYLSSPPSFSVLNTVTLLYTLFKVASFMRFNLLHRPGFGSYRAFMQIVASEQQHDDLVQMVRSMTTIYLVINLGPHPEARLIKVDPHMPATEETPTDRMFRCVRYFEAVVLATQASLVLAAYIGGIGILPMRSLAPNPLMKFSVFALVISITIGFAAGFSKAIHTSVIETM